MSSIINRVTYRAKRLAQNFELATLGDPEQYPIGSDKWLAATEKWFGGYHTKVERRKVSDNDPRTPEKIATGGMTGGDRMIHHGYATHYAAHLVPFVGRREQPLVVAEFGILRGTGIALWSKLFPDADIIGFDIDLSHTLDNLANLKERGAFVHKEPELHIFDQFADGPESIGMVLNGRTIDVCIDDGFHSHATILNTAHAVKPYLSEKFVFFIEDNATVAPALAEEFPDWRICSYRELSVAEARK